VVAGHQHHRVDALVVEQFPEVLVWFWLSGSNLLSELLGLFETCLIDVADGRDPATWLRRECRHQFASAAAQADDAHVHHVVGGRSIKAAGQRACRSTNERPSIHDCLLTATSWLMNYSHEPIIGEVAYRVNTSATTLLTD